MKRFDEDYDEQPIKYKGPCWLSETQTALLLVSFVCVCVCVCVSVTHGVDGRVGVNLQRVDVIAGVLEQAVVRVEHLVRQQVEPLPEHSTRVRGQGSNRTYSTTQRNATAT